MVRHEERRNRRQEEHVGLGIAARAPPAHHSTVPRLLLSSDDQYHHRRSSGHCLKPCFDLANLARKLLRRRRQQVITEQTQPDGFGSPISISTCLKVDHKFLTECKDLDLRYRPFCLRRGGGKRSRHVLRMPPNDITDVSRRKTAARHELCSPSQASVQLVVTVAVMPQPRLRIAWADLCSA